MPRGVRLEFFQAKVEDEYADRRYINASVKPDTVRKYNLKINQIEEYLKLNEKEFLCPNQFARFLDQVFTQSEDTNIAATYRAAVIFTQIRDGRWLDGAGHNWMYNVAIKKVVTGFEQKMKEEKFRRIRGAITPIMYGQLLSLLPKKSKRHWQLAYDIFAYTGIRIEEGIRMNVGDLGRSRPGWLLINMNKCCSRFSPDSMPTYEKRLTEEGATAIKNLENLRISRGAKDGDPLMPKEQLPLCGALSELIKEAAVCFGWHPELAWEGFHNFRHGAMLQLRLKNLPTDCVMEVSQMSASTFKEYSRTNEERIELINNHEALRQQQTEDRNALETEFQELWGSIPTDGRKRGRAPDEEEERLAWDALKLHK